MGDLGGLIKEAGLNPGYKALPLQLRVTWDEFYANVKMVAANAAEVTSIGPEEKALQQLRKLFELIDASGDGSVNTTELDSALNQDGSIGKLIEEAGFDSNFCVLDELDANKDERITWDEFEARLRGAARKEVEELGDVIAAVVLEQQNAAEEEEKDETVVVPSSMWCCAGQ